MSTRKTRTLFVWWISFAIVDYATAFSSKSSSSFLNIDLDNFFNSLNVNNKISKKTAVIAGATGYIGKATVRESVRQGYNTIALVRDLSKAQSEEGKLLYDKYFEGATLVQADVCDLETLKTVSLYN